MSSSAFGNTPPRGLEEIPRNGALLDKQQWHQVAETAFIKSRRTGEPLSVLFIDVNYFKDINDVFGHEVGDEAIEDIRDLIRVLVDSFRTGNRPGDKRDLDVVSVSETQVPRMATATIDDIEAGHIGGDEFAVICQADEQGAMVITERLRTIFQTYLDDPEHLERANLRELEIGLAIGESTLTPEMTNVSQLLQAADKAMYKDKIDQVPGLDEHQKQAMRVVGSVVKAAGVRVRDLPKIIRMHPELFEEG